MPVATLCYRVGLCVHYGWPTGRGTLKLHILPVLPVCCSACCSACSYKQRALLYILLPPSGVKLRTFRRSRVFDFFALFFYGGIIVPSPTTLFLNYIDLSDKRIFSSKPWYHLMRLCTLKTTQAQACDLVTYFSRLNFFRGYTFSPLIIQP